MREHLEGAARQLGSIPQELQGPPMPAWALPIWELFCALSAARQPGFSGPCPLSYLEIEAYCRLTGIEVSPFMLAALRALDAAFVAQAHD